jgi:nucleoside-triphosphatase
MEGILVLDEIGRMELLSDRFKQEVKKAFSNPSITVLATIPVKPAPFIETLRQSANTVVLVVSSQAAECIESHCFNTVSPVQSTLVSVYF